MEHIAQSDSANINCICGLGDAPAQVAWIHVWQLIHRTMSSTRSSPQRMQNQDCPVLLAQFCWPLMLPFSTAVPLLLCWSVWSSLLPVENMIASACTGLTLVFQTVSSLSGSSAWHFWRAIGFAELSRCFLVWRYSDRHHLREQSTELLCSGRFVSTIFSSIQDLPCAHKNCYRPLEAFGSSNDLCPLFDWSVWFGRSAFATCSSMCLYSS